MMLNKILAGSCAVIFVFHFACKDNGVTPPPPPKDPRTYTWTRDTLGDGSYQSLPRSIWASGPNDVYVVGHASNLFQGKIWHYDGIRWTDLTAKYVEAFPGQQVFYFAPADVYGFGKNDVWIAGYKDTSAASNVIKKGFIMHFNGAAWEDRTPPNALNLQAVWGTSSTDLWVGGPYGHFHHSNGSSWKDFSIPDSVSVSFVIGSNEASVYAQGFTHNSQTGSNYWSLLEWNGISWQTNEVAVDNIAANFTTLAVYNGAIYSVAYESVRKRISRGVWETLYTNSNADFLWLTINSDSNLFAVGGNSGEQIYHYNGQDWYRFTQFSNPNIWYYNARANGSEVFVLGGELSAKSTAWPRSFVLHGK